MIIQNLDAWDRREFLEQMEINENFRDIELSGSQLISNWAEFMVDVFGGLYKYAPNVRNVEDVPAHQQWADTMYQEISQLKEWKTLRERTIMKPEAAAAATSEFCRKLVDSLHKNSVDLNLDITDSLSKIRHTARTACESASDVADDINEAINAFGYGNGSGKPEYASPNQKREIASKLINNKYLKEIAVLAGRMRRIANEKQKSKTRHGVDEITNIKIGEDLARLIPAEVSKLANNTLELDFCKKYLEKGLMQYKLQGKERKGKGPIIVCIDESSSMRGNNDIWAKAVAMALLQIAQKQKRPYSMIHFNTSVSRVDDFNGVVDSITVMDAISHFSGGGTNFAKPIFKALDIIKNSKTYKDADIIFITDGEYCMNDHTIYDINKRRNSLETNIMSITIYENPGVCGSFSDKVITVPDINSAINSDAPVLEAMFSI